MQGPNPVSLPLRALAGRLFTTSTAWEAHPDSRISCIFPPSAKMDLEVKASGRSKTPDGLALSLDFLPTGNLSAHV